MNIVSFSQTSGSAPADQRGTQRHSCFALSQYRPLQHHSQSVGDVETQMFDARCSLQSERRILRKRSEIF